MSYAFVPFLTSAALVAALALVLVDACRVRRRSYLAARRALEEQLGRPLTAGERWSLYE